MNRSILIVICDFLLVSLLAFSTVDINKVSDESTPRQPQLTIATNEPASGNDLAAVMRQALNEERQNRDLLLGELARAKDAATRQQSLLGEREHQLQTYEQELRSREQQAAQLRQQQTNLQQQFASAQGSIQNLSQQLEAAATDASVSKEKLATLQKQLSGLEESNRLAVAEQQRLSTELQVAEVERRHAAETAARMQEEVKHERAEKLRLTQQTEQLAEGVKALASKSGELATEIRENRPLAPNTIFADFLTNRVEALFEASRPGLIGATRRRETQTVLVASGAQIYAVYHVQDTPFTLTSPGTDWQSLAGFVRRGDNSAPINSVAFSARDPRILFVPVAAADARKLGVSVYKTSTEPFKFQDAVLVGAGEGYYGECNFQFDLSTPDYVRLDRNFVKGLFGKFNPSRGDLVFSRTGELMGIMANSTYCLVLKGFESRATLGFGQLQNQHTGVLFSELYHQLFALPSKLQ